MKLLKIISQNRRDCRANIQCEFCNNVENDRSAYDDRNFWANVLPQRKCEKCKKSTKSENGVVEYVETRHEEWEMI